MYMNTIIPIITGLFGLATGMLIPFVKWKVEKLKIRHKERLLLINNLRESISSENFEERIFMDSSLYSRLRKHLSAEMINRLETYSNVTQINYGYNRTGIKYDLLDQINKLEEKWKLI
jgi:hypothetical protein